MKKSQYTKSQIVKAPNEVESCCNDKDLCCEMGISEGMYCIRSTRYCGLEASDVKKLEDESQRLKQMYSDLSLESKTSRILSKKTLKPAKRLTLVVICAPKTEPL